ncbi:MAG TPA: 3'(2'),5'-bisphosphate nucleotidase CysQ [Acidimicrobiales bacterium]|nr:3'(2'),5'-bisphosphate nucleotidase CysQ [Acidimicrobiales bacterium]
MATDDDHRLAANLAHECGAMLVSLRERLIGDGAGPERLRAEGDRHAHELLMTELHAAMPDDVVLSEESPESRTAADPERVAADRVWIVDPLDGTREYGERRRGDWAVHVALVEQHQPTAAAVALPAQKLLLTTDPAPAALPEAPTTPRIVVSRSRPPAWADDLEEGLKGTLVPMGSAGAKAMMVVLGAADVYAHSGGQWEWDSAAPIGVARAAGLHTSRLDGSPLEYNTGVPYLPDLVICRPELAAVTLHLLAPYAKNVAR